jgi:NitT/TauT family transport system substrate-binding protein
MIDGLLSGQVDFGVVATPGLATLWDKTVGTPREVRALSCVQLQPFMLVTDDAAVKTIADFTEKDRIAVPPAKISAQALCLEMAAARLWGNDQYERPDPLTVTLSHPDAAAGVISGKSTINSHYAVSPFYYYELATPGVHLVLKSNDTLGGPHVNGVLVAAPAFRNANPIIARAVFAAQQEANAFITAHPKDAAAIHIELSRDTHALDAITTMVADPDNVWTTVPQKRMVFVDFMHKVGRLKHSPAFWKDLFLPEVQDGQGS